jgi:hypothetical protein
VPSVEGVMFKDGMINLMQCKIHSLIEKKENIMGCKWDIVTKHQAH